MSKSLGLLLTKAANCVGSQAKLAQTMNQPTTVISDWKCGRRAISSERIAELARVAGEDEGKWIALITVEKTGHEGAKKWIQQLAGTALCVLFLVPVVTELCIM